MAVVPVLHREDRVLVWRENETATATGTVFATVPVVVLPTEAMTTAVTAAVGFVGQ